MFCRICNGICLNKQESQSIYISTAVYGASLFILLSFYHPLFIMQAYNLNSVPFIKSDHCAIYVLIKGTYTPFYYYR
ncbi:hemolysin III family protein (plasmid) [Pseudoalteromonas espejiana]